MKNLLVLAIAIATLIACSKKEDETGNVHISGTIEGLSQGKLYIQKIQDTALVVLDSIMIKGDPNFESHITLDSPEMLYLFLDRGQTNSIDNSLPFFAEPGTITINTKLKEFFAAAKITGSKNHDLFIEFNNLNKRFTDENLSIMEKRLQNEVNFNQKTQDSINEAFDKLVKRKYLYVANYAATHADYEIAPYLALSEIANINVTFLDTIASKMTPQVANSKYGKMLTEHIKEIKETK